MSNVQAIATRLQASVMRTLRGAKPRHLSKRFRQLLQSDGGTITIFQPETQGDKKTVTVHHVKTNRLGVTGHAIELARNETKLKEARTANGIKDRGTVTGRHCIVAKVLCWLFLTVGLLGQAGCLDNLTTDVETSEGPCETFTNGIDGGATVTVCAIKDPRK